jgi:hypothetical protein
LIVFVNPPDLLFKSNWLYNGTNSLYLQKKFKIWNY